MCPEQPPTVDAPLTFTLPRFEPLSLALSRRAILVGRNKVGKTHLLCTLARVYGVPRLSRGDFVPPPQDAEEAEAVEHVCRQILPDELALIGSNVRAIMRAAYTLPVVIVDDLGERLHMGAQYRLARALKDAQDARPDLRVIYATHSPYAIVDDEPASNVFVLARDPRVLGPDENPATLLTRVRRLSEYPFPRWVGMLSAADLWASSGEDWVWTGVIGGGG